MENKIYGYIYIITNLINNKQYIGQTTRSIKIRFTEHCSYAKNNKSLNMIIIKAIKKYRKENFKIEEIGIAYNQEQLNFIEGFYIDLYNTLAPNGYNITNIINGTGKLSIETKNKLKKLANSPERLKLQSETGIKSRGRKLGGKSKYCGVSIKRNKYISTISFNKKIIHIGYYNNEEYAAKAYDIKALEFFGKDANINFPELREKYLNNEIIVNKNTSKSGVKGIYFHTRTNKWVFKWFDKNLNKYKEKSFKYLDKAKQFKKETLINNKSS